MSDERLFSTRDIYIASTLVALGHELTQIDYQIEGSRQSPVGYFGFRDTPELRDTEMKFLRGELRVEPKSLFESMKGLKGSVNSQYKSPHSSFNKGRFS